MSGVEIAVVGGISANVLEKRDVTVAVILPLPREIVGAELMFSDNSELQSLGIGPSCSLCEVPGLTKRDPTHIVALAQPTQIGNTYAAICVTRLKLAFPKLHSVILCGIAGGVPKADKADRDVYLGDIVVLNEDGVLPYDFGHLRVPEACEREDLSYVLDSKAVPTKPDHIFQDILNRMCTADLRGERPWLERLRQRLPTLADRDPRFRRPAAEVCSYDEIKAGQRKRLDRSSPSNEPRLFAGGIGSANCVLKHPFRRDVLRERTPPILAVEMEAAGVADACRAFDLRFTVVRGICDYCDTNKNDDWQHYAAAVAASFAYCMIQHIPAIDERSKVRRYEGQLVPDTRDFELAASETVALQGASASSLRDVETLRSSARSKSDEVKLDDTQVVQNSQMLVAEATIRLQLSAMERAKADHDTGGSFGIAQEVESLLERDAGLLPPEFIVGALSDVAAAYASWANQCEESEGKRWKNHALELVQRARGLQG